MRIFKRIFDSWFICISASVGYVLCLLADKFWLAELAVHWRLHMAVACLLFVLIFIKRKIFAMWMLALTLGFAIPALQAFAPASEPEGKAKANLRILQFNVLYSNNEFAKSIPWIIAQDADIVVLQEVNQERADELGELKKHYAWSQVKLNEQRDAFGMAIFSNKPVTKFDYVDIGDGWNHYTKTEFLISNTKLNLYELHTPPPVSEFFFAQRNINMQLMADVMEKDATPHRLLIGDLNTTVYSPYFQNMANQAKLHHAQQGYNVEGTWPSFWPIPLHIGIDHLLASRQIKIEKRTVATYQGSDHFPVITDITLYE